MQNFRRKISVIIAEDSDGLDLSTFHTAFKVEKSAAEIPNAATVQIWNLAKTTYSKIIDKEYSRLILQAGYEDNYGVLFDGDITEVTVSRTGPDVILEIKAEDGGNAYSYALCSQSIASGYSRADLATQTATKMTEQGAHSIDISNIDSAVKYPRGRTIFGTARALNRELAKSDACQWSLQDGKMVFCKTDSTLSDKEGFLLSAETGLIGAPKSDKTGVQVSCCLNPKLHIYDPLQIESEFLTGGFKILAVTHNGDTHSSTWRTDLKAVSLDASNNQLTSTK